MEQLKTLFLKKYSLLGILIVPIIAAFYYAILLPVSFDEAYTFLLFTTKGYWESMSTYPAPNNHILHSVITNGTKEIPFFTDLFKLRISSIVVNVLTLMVLYKFVSLHFSQKLALAVTALYSMFFLTVYYSYMSRGYGLYSVFFIVDLYCVFNIIKEYGGNKNWVVFCLSSVLGFYTMPCFLYPFITLIILLLMLHRKSIVKQMITGCVTGVLVLALYYPILSHQGIEAIAGNTYVKPIGLIETLKQLPKFYLKTVQEISGIHWIVMFCLLLFSVYSAIKSNDKIIKWTTIAFILAPIVLLTLHRVIPFVRVFVYYNFIISLLLCLVLSQKINALSYKKLLTIVVILQCFLWGNFERKIYAYEDKDDALNITSDTITQKIIGNKTYFFNGSLLAAHLKFNLITKGYKNYSMKEIHTPASSADTIQNFDYIVIAKERDRTVSRKPFISTSYYNIYKGRKPKS